MLIPQAKLDSLQDPVKPLLQTLFQKAKDDLGLDLILVSGLRTFAQQQADYDQGRTTPGNIITHAKPGSSWHNYGLAFDVAIQDPTTGQATWPASDDPIWGQLGEIGSSLGLVWGGSFSGLVDADHFEYHPGLTLSDVRDYFQKTGQVLLAAASSPPSATNTALLLGVAGLLAWYYYEHFVRHAI